MNTIQYILVNKSLKMSAGKAMAQVAHAVNLVSNEQDLTDYWDSTQRTVIVLEATADQIVNMREYLESRDVRSAYVIDEGVNEIPTMTVTALASQQIDVTDVDTREMFRGFDLYKHGRFFG